MADEPFVNAVWHRPADKLPPIQETVPVRLLSGGPPTRGLWSHRGFWVVQQGSGFKDVAKNDVACWLETTARDME